jgi:hypothetical protein
VHKVGLFVSVGPVTVFIFGGTHMPNLVYDATANCYRSETNVIREDETIRLKIIQVATELSKIVRQLCLTLSVPPFFFFCVDSVLTKLACHQTSCEVVVPTIQQWAIAFLARPSRLSAHREYASESMAKGTFKELLGEVFREIIRVVCVWGKLRRWF